MSTMKIDGGCHCGRVRYEAEIDPDRILICHCTDCQVLSGSAFRVVAFTVEDGFRLLDGTLKDYVKTADSGAERAQAFCPDCGTHIYASGVGEGPKVYGIRVGTTRQRAELRPKSQYWCGSALDWIGGVAALPET